MNQQNFQNKISNHHQIGGIETSIIDNGKGKGTRIAWVNTGTGLRYKIVLDRAMDIADAFFNEHSLAWLSHVGVTWPEPFSNQGIDWLKTFNGGLLTTCGLDHVGGPENDEFGQRGLHGQISNTPAEIVSIIQPDPILGKVEMSITGIIRQSQVFGPNYELKRTISGKLGEATISIRDEICNRGNTNAPLMLLYHINFGWPLVDEGTDLIWKGKCESRGGELDNAIFNESNDFKKCQEPLEAHNGYGEAVGFIDPDADNNESYTFGLHNANLGIAVAIEANKSQLPNLINWQHWGKGEYVTAIEPSTNPPIGQSAAREQGTLLFLEPEEVKTYELKINVLNDTNSIQDFINTNN